MPYSLSPTDPVALTLERIAAEELTLATNLLGDDALEGKDERIHEARKSLKKLRALLRLSRCALPRATFEAENAVFRDSARKLSSLRAAVAALECLEALVSEPNAGLTEEAIALARKRLENACLAPRSAALDPVRAARAELELALPRVTEWRFDCCDWAVLGPGLRTIYARGRKGMTRAITDGTTDSFHAWRKQVKYLWYSIRLIEPCWQRGLRALASELDALGETLGHEHDLADVERLILEQSMPSEIERVSPVLALARARRFALRAAASSSGRRIFAETPKAFTQRLGAYFLSWQEESRAEPMQEAE